MMLIQLQVRFAPDQISHLAGLIRIQIGRFELVIECGQMLKDLLKKLLAVRAKAFDSTSGAVGSSWYSTSANR